MTKEIMGILVLVFMIIILLCAVFVMTFVGLMHLPIFREKINHKILEKARKKKREKAIILKDFLNKQNPSRRYSDIINCEEKTSLKYLLEEYKENYLNDELEELKKESAILMKTVSVDDPYIGDMKIALSRLIMHMEK